VVSTLYRHGVLSKSSDAGGKRCYVLEVGGGYGGLAHHLSKICLNSTYVIVDLPETLLFSASYLTLLNPHKKIYIYDSNEFPGFVQNDDMGSYDFVLLPNYMLRSLTRSRFDLVLNIASLQEMRTSQVEVYLDFIQQVCSGVFYSWNANCHPRNRELSDLSDLLGQRFDLTSVPDYKPHAAELRKKWLKSRLVEKVMTILRRMGILCGLLEIPHAIIYREYICEPKAY
jgi:hypothetical protein